MQPLSSSRAGWTYTWMHSLVWLPPWSKSKTFHHSRRLSLATFLTLTIPPTREPLFDSFHCGIILLDFERIHINEIKILCLASFTQLTFVGFICDVRWFDSSFSLLRSIPLVWIYHSLFSHWWIFGLSGFFFLLWIKLLWKSPIAFCGLVHAHIYVNCWVLGWRYV